MLSELATYHQSQQLLSTVVVVVVVVVVILTVEVILMVVVVVVDDVEEVGCCDPHKRSDVGMRAAISPYPDGHGAVEQGTQVPVCEP